MEDAYGNEMKKILRYLSAIIGLSVVAAVISTALLAPRYTADIEFRCQVDLQFARLSSAMLEPLEGRTRWDIIQMSKDACESEKKRDKFFKELDKTLEYFF